MMSGAELLAVLIVTPPLAVVAGWIGRKAMRHIWMMDRPYSERIAAIKGKL